MSGSGEWRNVARLQDLADGDVTAVTCGDQELALYRVGSEVYATGMMCSHGAARLCEGFLEGYFIECPLHQGAFDIRNGAPAREPAVEPIDSYAVRVDEQGAVSVLMRP